MVKAQAYAKTLTVLAVLKPLFARACDHKTDDQPSVVSPAAGRRPLSRRCAFAEEPLGLRVDPVVGQAGVVHEDQAGMEPVPPHHIPPSFSSLLKLNYWFL